MAFPQKDIEYEKFTIGEIITDGEYWKIKSTCGKSYIKYPIIKGVKPKLGQIFRVYYDPDSTARGLYIGSRKVTYRKQRRLDKINLPEQQPVRTGIRLVSSR